MNSSTFSTSLRKTMHDQGRKWKWLGERLGLSSFGINYKLENNSFTFEEENKIRKILKIN